ncbi:NAD(P)H-hydrate dehydratase, partial [Aliarcobacter butzleri]|uniref:NAD(P)H-hydrate dehydratase n=1 Tax=Aliarcobacter butzleri TaxID=28197 RepID=UPI003B210A2D
IGMGLGEYDASNTKEILITHSPKTIAADLFYDDLILQVLDKAAVLTPHPKEFVSLLKLSGTADISAQGLQNNSFLHVEKFSKKY